MAAPVTQRTVQPSISIMTAADEIIAEEALLDGTHGDMTSARSVAARARRAADERLHSHRESHEQELATLRATGSTETEDSGPSIRIPAADVTHAATPPAPESHAPAASLRDRPIETLDEAMDQLDQLGDTIEDARSSATDSISYAMEVEIKTQSIINNKSLINTAKKIATLGAYGVFGVAFFPSPLGLISFIFFSIKVVVCGSIGSYFSKWIVSSLANNLYYESAKAEAIEEMRNTRA
jgi:hypothetical protein